MPAHNKLFGKLGVKVITRTSVRPLTVSDDPNCVRSRPNFAKTEGKIVILVEIYDKNEVSTLSDSDYEMALIEFLENYPL